MNLPLVLDIAIGLFFIYLILSLLAAEIQELVATLLQWRATHLKESIEVLLSGGEKNRKAKQDVRTLAEKLYSDPLIKNLNQEAKGIASLPRMIIRVPARICFCIKSKIFDGVETERNASIFGNNRHTGPSYIPAETFATTLLETSKIPTLVQKLSEIKLEEFKQDKLKEVKAILDNLKNELKKIV